MLSDHSLGKSPINTHDIFDDNNSKDLARRSFATAHFMPTTPIADSGEVSFKLRRVDLKGF